jgi:hypothetical protein
MFFATLRTNANCNAFVFVGDKFKQIGATLAFDVGEVVDRILVLFAVPRHLGTNISVIVPIPVVTTFCECHRFVGAELINIPVCVPTIIPKHHYSNRYPGLFQLFLAVSKKLLSEERSVK